MNENQILVSLEEEIVALKSKNEQQAKLIKAFIAYRNFIKVLTTTDIQAENLRLRESERDLKQELRDTYKLIATKEK